MSWDYETKLKSYIVQAQNDSGMTDYLFEVCNEQIFVKKKTLDPKTVYVVVKYLSSTNTLNAVTQPIQILVSCEQNQIQASQIVFSKLVDSHNFEAVIDGGTYIKQDYRQPVVLSNFNEVSYGYRTLMYISATLFIMENVMDIEDFSIKLASRTEELTEEQTEDMTDWFTNGGVDLDNTAESIYYVIYTSDLIALNIDDNNPINIMRYLLNDIRPGSHGRLWVNGAEMFGVRFLSDRVLLMNNYTGTDYSYFLYATTERIILKFTAWNRMPGTREYNEDNVEDLFPIIRSQFIPQTIDIVKPISFVMSYSMTPNTQPIPPQRIATSVKSVSTFSVTLGVPLISNYQFITVCNKIAAGIVSGNTSFIVSFKLGSVEFNDVPMKLVSSQITTAINEVPGLQIGLIK